MVATVKVIRKKHMRLPTKFDRPSEVAVGFPKGKVDADIVARAIWTHFGTRRGIPARTFLLNAIRDNRSKYVEALTISGKRILRGDVDVKQVMEKLGILAQGHVQMEITNLRTPPNARSTIKRKGSSNPLIDSGEMRQAVTYKVGR